MRQAWLDSGALRSRNMNALRFAVKAALVTGSSQGIGEAVAWRLAEEGADMVVNYHTHPEGAERVVEQIRGMGRKVVALQADLGQLADVQALIQQGVRSL